MATAFFTGFPGFLGSRLLPLVLDRDPSLTALCLVQPTWATTAKARVDELVGADPSLEGRIELREGDITRPGLGLDGLPRGVTQAWHLAAVYDLAVPREVGMRVNVAGTRNVLDALRECPDLERLHYVSTCYVSGRWAGPFREDDLDKGQSFNNYYEETKHLAEVEVRSRMDGGLPATVYRPSIVIGDSTTGETQKYDGPYFVIRWLLRNPKVAVLPVVGDPAMTRLNLVPRDFVVRAIAHLSGLPQSAGKTYQLADPDAVTVDELIRLLAHATGRRIVRVPLPRRTAKWALDRVPGVYRLLQIPSSAVDYFVHPTHYLTDNADADLAGSGLRVPPLSSYVGRLVDFVRAHPEISSAAMV
jgi:nucleoside-diphosphate-sugar epimerase